MQKIQRHHEMLRIYYKTQFYIHYDQGNPENLLKGLKASKTQLRHILLYVKRIILKLFYLNFKFRMKYPRRSKRSFIRLS